MFKQLHNNEKGAMFVEASFVFPIMILIIIAMYYASIMAYERAALQSGVESTALLYKNSYSDDYIDIGSNVTASKEEDMVSYDNLNTQESLKFNNPYDCIFMTKDGTVKATLNNGLFKSITGYLFWGNTLNVEVNHENYIVYKKVSITATETAKLPLDFSIIGLPNEYKISATATAMVNDTDEFIRDTDLVMNVVKRTKLWQSISKFGEKIGSLYNKLTS